MKTDEQAERELERKITETLPVVRSEALAIGPLHPTWDTILDFEALIAGKPTLLGGTRLEKLRVIARAFKVPGVV